MPPKKEKSNEKEKPEKSNKKEKSDKEKPNKKEKSDEKNVIGFYGIDGEYGFLSQWYPCTFTEGETIYNSVEQYMMVQKAKLFNDDATIKKIMNSSDPKKIKALGRKVKNFNEAEWDKHKRLVIFDGNMLKFCQNKAILKELHATGDKILAEASPYDQIYGIGIGMTNKNLQDPSQWKGQNLLGNTLMRVRGTLK